METITIKLTIDEAAVIGASLQSVMDILKDDYIEKVFSSFISQLVEQLTK